MRITIVYLFFSVLAACQFQSKNSEVGSDKKMKETIRKEIIIEPKFEDTVKANITDRSTNEDCYFKTKVYNQYYINDTLDVIDDNDSASLSSWYHYMGDTIDLVVHIGYNFGPSASLLLRFIKDSIQPLLFAFPHEPIPMFKLNAEDTFLTQIEVPAKYYILKLSARPDTASKRPVYGYIDMESNDYFMKILSDEDVRRYAVQKKKKTYLKFFFKSQYYYFD